MPSYSHEISKQHLELVRSVMVQYPRISTRSLVERLQIDYSVQLHRNYAVKLQRKVILERRARFCNSHSLFERLAEIQDKTVIIEELLWLEARNAKNSSDRMRALKAIHEIELCLLEAEMDTGIFERKLGTVRVEERKIQLADIVQNMPTELRNDFLGGIQKTLMMSPENKN